MMVNNIDMEKGKMIIKEFGKDFDSEDGALTLNTCEVTKGDKESGIHQRKHKDGWTIKGEICEDYFVWVNKFEAKHPEYGRVWGDFEDKVYADSEKGFQDFYNNHTPEAWNYGDI